MWGTENGTLSKMRNAAVRKGGLFIEERDF